jgi:hypothetical protein
MIFFTRPLYQDIQPISDWKPRPAEREWNSRSKILRRYEKIITPLLPLSAVQLLRKSLHDAEVESISQNSGKLVLVMDARPCAAGSYRGYRVRLTFDGVRRHINTRGLIGQWWLYSEVHLCSHAKFSLHVLFTKSELEIEADKLSIKRL